VGSPPEPIDMPLGALSGVPDVITHTKFCVNRLRGFPWQHPQKCHFLYFFERPSQQFCTAVQTDALSEPSLGLPTVPYFPGSPVFYGLCPVQHPGLYLPGTQNVPYFQVLWRMLGFLFNIKHQGTEIS